MKVKDLLTNETKWTTDYAARNMIGNEVSYKDPSACCWCMIGAIQRCYGPSVAEDIMIKVRTHLGTRFITHWNDDPIRSFQDVRNLVETLNI